MKIPVILFTISILLLGLHSSVEKNSLLIYIAPDGSDLNPGTIDYPFASLEKARDHIRKLTNEGLQSDVYVYLREGVYYLTETFVLGLEDSAPEGFRITYRNFPGERPVLSSGVKLTGWVMEDNMPAGLPHIAEGKIWSAVLPDNINSFYTLYDGNTRLPRAVTNGFYPVKPYEGNNPVQPEDLYHLHFPPGKLKDWPHLNDVEIFIIPSVRWTMNILPLASVDENKNIATTGIPATYPLKGVRFWYQFPQGTVWVENVFEGMNKPGNWVLDTGNRKVYLWPKGNKPGNDILAPGLRVLVKVAGKSLIDEPVDIPVRGIHFKGITFTHADRGSWTENDSGIQHDWEMEDSDNAMLRFRGAEDCSVDSCHFYNAGGNAIRLDYHAQHIRIQNNHFHDLGGSAVMMLGYGPGTKDVNKFNKVINNHIHDCGQIWWHSQMITAWQSGENIIANNHIHNVPRKAICIAGVRPPFFNRADHRENVRSIRFKETGNARQHEEIIPFMHARNNIVEYNHIHNALEMLGDGAAINVSGAGLGNLIRFNYIHDISNPNVNAAIRCDNAQHGTLISHNIIFKTPNAGISPKGYNEVRNNFVIGASLGTTKGFIQGLGNFGNSDIVNNIFVSTDSTDHFYRFIHDDIPPYVYQKMNDNVIDHNIYYSVFNPCFKENNILMELKEYGFDKHSLYTDPMFIDWENGDFRLREESPAFSLGISQIDIIDRVGPVGNY